MSIEYPDYPHGNWTESPNRNKKVTSMTNMTLYYSCNDCSLERHEDQSMAQMLLNSPNYNKTQGHAEQPVGPEGNFPNGQIHKCTFFHRGGREGTPGKGELHYVIIHNPIGLDITQEYHAERIG